MILLMLGTLNLGSDQSLPPELAKHYPLDSSSSDHRCQHHRVRPGVRILDQNVLARFEGGGKIDDFMVLLRNVPQASKSRKSLFQLAQAASREVFVYGLLP